MKKITFDSLTVELGRNCNMIPQCNHCFRGDAQNIKITPQIIDEFFEQTEMIGSLFFAGGEPTLYVDEMRYFLQQLYKCGIPLLDLSIISNGLIFSDEIVDLIKDYSKMIKYCCETGFGHPVDITHYVVLGISIDRYHNNKAEAEANLLKYSSALEGYAQVVRVAYGNTPRKEGRGANLRSGMCKLDLTNTMKRRVEILSKSRKPLCPQYQTYKLLYPEQIIICCDMYLSAKGDILTSALGMHDYSIVDNNAICSVQDNIYENILFYNQGRIDCCSLIKQEAIEKEKHPLNDMGDALYWLMHAHEDDSDMIQKDPVIGYIPQDTFKNNPAYIDKIRRRAAERDYLVK